MSGYQRQGNGGRGGNWESSTTQTTWYRATTTSPQSNC